MKALGPLHHFLLVKVVQNQHTGEIWICQHIYTERLLHNFGMEDLKPVNTPVNPDVKLTRGAKEDRVDQKIYITLLLAITICQPNPT